MKCPKCKSEGLYVEEIMTETRNFVGNEDEIREAILEADCNDYGYSDILLSYCYCYKCQTYFELNPEFETESVVGKEINGHPKVKAEFVKIEEEC